MWDYEWRQKVEYFVWVEGGGGLVGIEFMETIKRRLESDRTTE